MLVVLALAVGGCASSTVAPSPTPRPSVPATVSPTAPSIACEPATTPVADDWNERVWYEVFVRSFADSDGDGIGDLRGLLERLDHLNDGDPATTDDLGVGGLWLMPIAESVSYHGYDVTDYRAVEPDYGTLGDLRALLDAAHERGMRVIVDFVPNHSSSEHGWFRESLVPGSPRDPWYVWSDEFPGWGGPGGEVVWREGGDRWYYAYFSETMPELDLTNPDVTAEFRDVARFWVEEVGVDGFRIDAAKHLIATGKDAQVNTPETLAWLAGFRESLGGTLPDGGDPLLVGEVWDLAVVAGAYVPDSLDLTFDFGLATGVRLGLENGRAGPLRTALLDSVRWWPPNRNATFLSNHDQDRIASSLRGDGDALRLGAFLLMTLPGVPFLYYGEEIGLTGRKPDERIRTPLPWTEERPGAGFTSGTPWQPLAEMPTGTSVAAQRDDPSSLLAAYRTLIAARGAEAPLRTGGAAVLETGSESVAAWLRTTADRTLLVVANLSDESVADYALDLAAGPLCGAVVPSVVAAMGLEAGTEPSPPSLTPSGGLDGYRPLRVLPPRIGLVIALEPVAPGRGDRCPRGVSPSPPRSRART